MDGILTVQPEKSFKRLMTLLLVTLKDMIQALLAVLPHLCSWSTISNQGEQVNQLCLTEIINSHLAMHVLRKDNKPITKFP